MKKSLPFALAALALVLATWWAWTNLRETVEGDGQAGARAPLLLSDPAPPPALPETTAEPTAPTPSAAGRDPLPPTPPERIVPQTVAPPEAADEADGGTTGAPEPAEADERRGPGPADATAASRTTELVGGVARPADRAPQEVEVRAGRAWIGTPRRWVEGIANTPGGRTLRALSMEAPRHAVEMEGYWIDRFEVTNHRYWVYLQRAAWVEIDTSAWDAATLPEIARGLIRDPPGNLDFDAVGLQLFQANRAVLLGAFGGLQVRDRDGLLDEQATWARVREREVPRGLTLRFYDRAPPGTWIGDRYPEREVDHPVRDLSLEEALGYALYAGRHVPSEIEWEYAARGPRGLDFPWGPSGRNFPERVNGGDPLPTGEEPTTVPAAHVVQGASWVGCLHMLGNVSEWTTSWLAPYPGAVASPDLPPHPVLVVRGGSAADRERLAVRPALRGWVRGRPEGGPRPRQRLPWTGFRTARYEEPGRSRLPTMRYRALSYGRLDPEALAPEIYEAVQGRIDDTDLRRRYEDLDTRPGVKTFVAHPLAAMALRVPGGAVRFSGAGDHGRLTEEALLAASETDGPLLFGLFHNDLILTNTWRTRGAAGPHQLETPDRYLREDCPPGTWLVGLLHRQLVLIRPDFELVYYVTTRDAPKALLSVIRQAPVKTRRRPTVSLDLLGGASRVDLELTVPLGEGRAADFVALVRLTLRTDPRETGAVPSWERSRLR